ncbi:MAG: hypothetical protein JWM82_726 [Myxococcales bacterium]|nr:hypothetical protein [Myxococcales bacterium]
MHAVMGLRYARESGEPAYDFDRYYEIVSATGPPGAHAAEYPIATVAVFRALAHLPDGRAGFGLGIVSLNLVSDATIIVALLWGWGAVAAAAFALLVIPVIDLFFNRIDPWSVAVATLAVAAWRRDRPRLAGLALAVGTAFKLWPFVLAGMLVVSPPGATEAAGRFRRSAVATFVATGSAMAIGALLLVGRQGLLHVVTLRGTRAWEIESLVGSLLHLAGTPARFETGAWRVGDLGRSMSTVLFVTAAPLSVYGAWRAARADRIGAGWLAAVAVLLLSSALLSAQYVIWLAPAAAIAWTEGDRASSLLTALAIFLTGVFWAAFPAVIAGHGPALVLVVVRNALLLSIAVGTLARLPKGNWRGDRRAL